MTFSVSPKWLHSITLSAHTHRLSHSPWPTGNLRELSWQPFSNTSVCVSERKVYALAVCVCVCDCGLVGTVGDFPSALRSLTSFHTDGFCPFFFFFFFFRKSQRVTEGGGGVRVEWIMRAMCERLSPSPSFPVWEGTLCPYLFLYPHGSRAQSHCSLSFCECVSVSVWESIWEHACPVNGGTSHTLTEHHDCDTIGCIFFNKCWFYLMIPVCPCVYYSVSAALHNSLCACL